MWETQVARQAEAGSQYYATEPDAVAEQMIGMVPLRRYGPQPRGRLASSRSCFRVTRRT